MTTVVEVAGARPNYMKIAPIHRALVGSECLRPVFVHTGQHYDWEMSEVFLRDLGLPSPDFELGVGSGTHAEQTAQVMLRLEPILLEAQPAVVVVVGDVNSTLGAALAAAKLTIPVAHVEAGLRSFDRTMPEELNRLVTDAISDLLFAPSEEAVENLVAEGISAEKVHLVGNVMIDTLEHLLPLARRSGVLDQLGLGAGRFLLATLHRPSNVDGDSSLRVVVDVLAAVAEELPVLLVAHPRTRKRLLEAGLMAPLQHGGVHVIEPLGYVDFLGLMASSAGVLTDSGGIQEETAVLGVPCLTMRDRTERPITLTHGTNQVVGSNLERILAAVTRIATGHRATPRRPPLWDGRAAERIVSILEGRFGGPPGAFR
jgi:UDP-N-acetylglucosamine 2-epimerase (non-hydrolysing)